MASSLTVSLTVGAEAPPFQLKALGSGREVSRPNSGPSEGPSDGPALLLVFHDQNTVDAVQTMQETVRPRYADARQLLIASVVNMKAVPVFLRSAAEGVMKGSYNKAAAAMPPGLDAADYVLILLDWDGKVSAAYGAHKVDKQPLLVLIDPVGRVGGVHRGVNLSEPALALVEALFAANPTAASAPAADQPPDDPAI